MGEHIILYRNRRSSAAYPERISLNLKQLPNESESDHLHR
ncbi:maleylacetoacetate isomerase, partial [Vibrio parahaemolyticus]|nr:maleylacetoacetate isomerase [Vibrio parahaemolyticus]